MSSCLILILIRIRIRIRIVIRILIPSFPTAQNANHDLGALVNAVTPWEFHCVLRHASSTRNCTVLATQRREMASYSRSGGTTARTATTKATTTTATISKSPFNHIEAIAKSNKPNRVIRKLSRPLEKSSLDLDRTSAEQGLGVYLTNDSTISYDLGSAARSLHDLTRSSNTTLGPRRNIHQRSTSGTSQFSSQTSGSYNRSGSFQHPFQQTPRPYTPPGAATSYQGSLSSELNREKEPLVEEETLDFRSPSTVSHHTVGTLLPLLHENSPIIPIKSSERSPIVLGTSSSSNLHLNPSPSVFTTSIFTTETATPPTNILLSSSDTISPPSFRSSMDRDFRLRSRSDAGAAERDYSARGQIEAVREARRQFEERERAKEERVAREQVRAMEKRIQKEARRAEGRARKSSASERSRGRGEIGMSEKMGMGQLGEGLEPREGLFARDYDSAPVQTPPATDPGFGQPKQRRKAAETATAAKRKTHSAWTTFMMWLRTRFLRMSKKRKD